MCVAVLWQHVLFARKTRSDNGAERAGKLLNNSSSVYACVKRSTARYAETHLTSSGARARVCLCLADKHTTNIVRNVYVHIVDIVKVIYNAYHITHTKYIQSCAENYKHTHVGIEKVY